MESYFSSVLESTFYFSWVKNLRFTFTFAQVKNHSSLNKSAIYTYFRIGIVASVSNHLTAL